MSHSPELVELALWLADTVEEADGADEDGCVFCEGQHGFRRIRHDPGCVLVRYRQLRAMSGGRQR